MYLFGLLVWLTLIFLEQRNRHVSYVEVTGSRFVHRRGRRGTISPAPAPIVNYNGIALAYGLVVFVAHVHTHLRSYHLSSLSSPHPSLELLVPLQPMQ